MLKSFMRTDGKIDEKNQVVYLNINRRGEVKTNRLCFLLQILYRYSPKG